ncbi:hypothetical protein EVAR_32735_1 [Eumeta japonica]|uniref:Uncharacterized protein n=1 Tax=Eumeta variegata TaxID=151549 RepID=A0A4C1XQR1_EUMVA|nr:hypothetical protein EVAR_32735_1 [Eumeta japonica]
MAQVSYGPPNIPLRYPEGASEQKKYGILHKYISRTKRVSRNPLPAGENPTRPPPALRRTPHRAHVGLIGAGRLGVEGALLVGNCRNSISTFAALNSFAGEASISKCHIEALSRRTPRRPRWEKNNVSTASKWSAAVRPWLIIYKGGAVSGELCFGGGEEIREGTDSSAVKPDRIRALSGRLLQHRSRWLVTFSSYMLVFEGAPQDNSQISCSFFLLDNCLTNECILRGKRAGKPPESWCSPSPKDTHNPRGVTNALPAS